jgi:hypothetical protein
MKSWYFIDNDKDDEHWAVWIFLKIPLFFTLWPIGYVVGWAWRAVSSGFEYGHRLK